MLRSDDAKVRFGHNAKMCRQRRTHKLAGHARALAGIARGVTAGFQLIAENQPEFVVGLEGCARQVNCPLHRRPTLLRLIRHGVREPVHFQQRLSNLRVRFLNNAAAEFFVVVSIMILIPCVDIVANELQHPPDVVFLFGTPGRARTTKVERAAQVLLRQVGLPPCRERSANDKMHFAFGLRIACKRATDVARYLEQHAVHRRIAGLRNVGIDKAQGLHVERGHGLRMGCLALSQRLRSGGSALRTLRLLPRLALLVRQLALCRGLPRRVHGECGQSQQREKHERGGHAVSPQTLAQHIER